MSHCFQSTTSLAPDLVALVHEYDDFLAANKLPPGSADEHVNDPAITQEQREWLQDFINRWQSAEDAEREQDRYERLLCDSVRNLPFEIVRRALEASLESEEREALGEAWFNVDSVDK